MTDGKHAEWVEARSSFDVWKFGRFTFEVGQYGDSGNYKGVIRHSVWRTVSMIAPCSLTLEEFILFCEETSRGLSTGFCERKFPRRTRTARNQE